MTLIEIHQNKPQFACSKIGDEVVLVPLQKNIANMNKLFTLNEVGAFIWDRIDGEQTKTDIVNAMYSNFEIDLKTAESDFDEFIESITLLMKS